MARRTVDPQQSFPELEQEVLERWRERDVFRESIRRREGAEPWVFYEGPPTANGRPGSHHVLARVFKDIYPRYKTMRGYYVERKGGWDCHGLPVEIAVEQQLGMENKARDRDLRDRRVQPALPRVGLRVPRGLERADRAHRVLDRPRRRLPHARRDLHRVGLVGAAPDLRTRACSTRATRSSPTARAAAPRCPATRWRWATRTSSTRRLRPLPRRRGRRPAAGRRRAARVDDDAVDAGLQRGGRRRPRARPTCARRPGRWRRRSCSPRRWSNASSASDGVRILDRFPGAALDGVRYEPPFGFIKADAYGERGHTVLLARLRHRRRRHRPRAHRDRLRRGRLPPRRAIRAQRRQPGARSTAPTTSASARTRGASSRTPTPTSSRTCARAGACCARRRYEHSYPHCWRCGDAAALLRQAARGTSPPPKLRDRLLAANEAVDWHPEHIKHGRFGDWLANNVDWALSRERYWGTPLPVWRCERPEHVHCHRLLRRARGALGRARSRTRTGPFVDEVGFPCPQCGERMQRVPEVIDVWFDSGCMPFAQHHAPFENEERFEARFPADFICEALDQTRGWFYSLLAVGDAAVRPRALRERRLPRA